MANSVDPDQTAPIGAVCSGSTLLASILNSSVMLGNYLQQMTSADDFSRRHFQMHFFLGALRLINSKYPDEMLHMIAPFHQSLQCLFSTQYPSSETEKQNLGEIITCDT